MKPEACNTAFACSFLSLSLAVGPAQPWRMGRARQGPGVRGGVREGVEGQSGREGTWSTGRGAGKLAGRGDWKGAQEARGEGEDSGAGDDRRWAPSLVPPRLALSLRS